MRRNNSADLAEFFMQRCTHLFHYAMQSPPVQQPAPPTPAQAAGAAQENLLPAAAPAEAPAPDQATEQPAAAPAETPVPEPAAEQFATPADAPEPEQASVVQAVPAPEQPQAPGVEEAQPEPASEQPATQAALAVQAAAKSKPAAVPRARSAKRKAAKKRGASPAKPDISARLSVRPPAAQLPEVPTQQPALGAAAAVRTRRQTMSASHAIGQAAEEPLQASEGKRAVLHEPCLS